MKLLIVLPHHTFQNPTCPVLRNITQKSIHFDFSHVCYPQSFNEKIYQPFNNPLTSFLLIFLCFLFSLVVKFVISTLNQNRISYEGSTTAVRNALYGVQIPVFFELDFYFCSFGQYAFVQKILKLGFWGCQICQPHVET